MRRFRSRLHAGDLLEATHEGIARAPIGGPFIRLRFGLVEGRVTNPRYKTYGCPAAIACSEALCELIEGKTLEEVGEVTPEDIAELLDGVPSEKSHCPELAASAWNRHRPI
jgi:NifU-like protein involved in Fe-S cluster formation